MDSSMEIDNSDFRREVQQINSVVASPGLGKRTRTQYEEDSHLWSERARAARFKKPISGNLPLGYSDTTLESEDNLSQEDRFLRSTPAWTHEAVQSPATAKRAYSTPPWGAPQAHHSPLTRGSPLARGSSRGTSRLKSLRSPLRPPRHSPLRPYTGLGTHDEMELPRYTSVRRIGGFCTTILSRTYLMIVGLWSFVTCGARMDTGDINIIAVQTDGSGRKRRAVSNSHVELPGAFPFTPSQLLTPPVSDSEPELVLKNQTQNVQKEEESPQSSNSRVTKPGAVKNHLQRPSKVIARPVQFTSAKERNAARAAAIGAVWKPYKSPPKFKAIERIRQNLSHETQARKDKEVDALINRAHKAVLESPEARRIKQAIQLRHEREAAEKAAAEKAAAEKVAAEKAAFEKAAAEKAAAEFAEEQRALQDALEAKHQAEEAEREALRAKKQKLVHDLKPDWKARVQSALSITNTAHVFTTIPGGASLTRGDLARILPANGGGGMQAWLNDESINGWFTSLVEAKKEQTGFVKGPNNVPSIEAYNSGWITTYTAKGIKGLTTWSRRKGIQGKKLLRADKIYFPINTGSHWMLLVICPSTHTIEFLDSMGGSPGKWFKFAREWLEMELGEAYIANEWKHSGVSSSYQTNGHDCGVFTCINALASAKDVDFSEVCADNMKQARKLMAAVLLNGGFKGDFQL
ncbi:Hypothetical protein R9X50_00730600 [Acrodontium crateriforme]|uniref:Ubiquitin-like protease family profile domain-containing protein n=1 Tax=Acrodontium crateriforme TaxID=150365 RepID=A0AAQ3MB61_9PEZI|nr:Hypothetical protein R9X50_00730600 [Acrodontium crateriforme]